MLTIHGIILFLNTYYNANIRIKHLIKLMQICYYNGIPVLVT